MAAMKKLLSSNVLLLTLLLAATFLIYQPGLYGDYIFDDISNITTNTSLQISEFSWQAIREAATSSFSGPLKRPLSMLTFAFNASTTGFGAPLFFKLTSLIVHLATGLAVFWLAGLLLERFRSQANHSVLLAGPDWTRLMITGIWLLHPLNLSTVIYIVQRMTSLSALFAFLAAAAYCIGRRRMENSQPHGWAFVGLAFVVLVPLSAFSKENGLLIPFLLLAIEITAFNYKKLGSTNRTLLGVLALVTVAVPTGLVVLAVLTQDPRLMGSYELRDFSVVERLLTQGRVIWLYVSMVLFPSVSNMGLYHDDFDISTGILSPVTTIFAWSGLIGLVVSVFVLKRKIPVLAFGVLWFLCGHLMESTVLPLEMVHEHRNYLPIFGLIFAGCYLLLERGPSATLRRPIFFAVAAYMSLISVVTFLRAEQWGDSVLHAVSEAENHPRSERAQLQLGRSFMMLMFENPRLEYYEGAKAAFEKSIYLSKTTVTAHFALIQLESSIKQPASPTIIDAAERVLSIGPVPPSAAPAFRALIDCQMFAHCKLSDADVMRLANAALKNPRAVRGVTTQIAIYLTQYQIDKMGDGNLAILTLQNALLRDPQSAVLHLSAARVFRVVGKFDQAKLYLEQATRFDSLATYRISISDEKKKLERDVAKHRI